MRQGATCTHSIRVPINRAGIAAWPPSPGWRTASSPAAAKDVLRIWAWEGRGASDAGKSCAPARVRARADRMSERGTLHVATMHSAHSAEPTRRDFLYIATGAAAGVAAVAALVPLIAQMNPDASTIAAGAPIEVDLTPITEGQVIKVFWRGKPIFINHRTKKQIADAEERRPRQASRSAARFGPREGRACAVPGADRHLHPSRLHSDRPPGRVMTAISAPATARSTTLPAASAAVRRRPISRCRPTSFSPTARSGSADGCPTSRLPARFFP